MKEKSVVVTGFGPFGSHKVNASWECVKLLKEQGLGDEVDLFIYELPVEYTTVKRQVPEIWENHKPDLVVHVGVSGIAKEITLEQQAHNEGYDREDIQDILKKSYEPRRAKTYLKAIATSMDPDEPAHLRSLIRIHAVRLKLLQHLYGLKVNSMDPDETARMRRLIWIHAGRNRLKSCKADDLCCVVGADDRIIAGLDMENVCDKVNKSGTKTKAVVSHDAGRYLCDFSYFTSLHINKNRTAFIHVPPLDKPHSIEELVEALKVAIVSMLEQADRQS